MHYDTLHICNKINRASYYKPKTPSGSVVFSRFDRCACLRAGTITMAVMALQSLCDGHFARNGWYPACATTYMRCAPTPPGAGPYAWRRQAPGRPHWHRDSSTHQEGGVDADLPFQVHVPHNCPGLDCIGIPKELVRYLGSCQQIPDPALQMIH